MMFEILGGVFVLLCVGFNNVLIGEKLILVDDDGELFDLGVVGVIIKVDWNFIESCCELG